IGSQKIIGVYQGVVGNATLLAGDGVFNSATLIQEDMVAFGTPPQDQDFFAVVWDYNLFGASTGELGTALSTGTALPAGAVLGQNYYVLTWKWQAPAPPPPALTFGGFLQPINNTGHEITENTSVFKAGSTVPVKFTLLDASGAVVQVPDEIPWVVPVQGPALSAPVSEAAYSDQPSSGSAYSWNGDHYQYNWKTSKTQSGYWYYLYVLPGDGNVYQTIVGLR
ncbi:MAG: hypothetical protein G01um101456_137, partial [Parcubacteria group bacterium Gr01-1014_56]